MKRPYETILTKLTTIVNMTLPNSLLNSFLVIISSAEYARAVCCREEFAARFADGWFVERSFGKALGNLLNFIKVYQN